jgi:hypothetical protein
MGKGFTFLFPPIAFIPKGLSATPLVGMVEKSKKRGSLETKKKNAGNQSIF